MAGKTDSYVCTLDAASLERAKKELNEDEKNRDGAVETFRTWVLQQKWLNTPTDYKFLLTFLRTKKFSQLEARKTLENFWKIRTQNKKWYADKSANDPKVISLLKTGFLLRLPHADSQGRIWLMDREGVLNVDNLLKDYGLETFFKTYSVIFDWVMMDERAQVNGVCWVVDMGGITLKHHTHIYSPSNMKNLADMIQGVYPIRLKNIKMYQTPPAVEFMIDLVKTFMKEKTRNRMHNHKTLVSVYETMDKDILPDEYLPDNEHGRSGSVADITDYMIKELTSEPVVEYINHLSNKDYKVHLEQKPDDLPAESFRKLNID